MISSARTVAIDDTVEIRPARPNSARIGNKKLFRITFFVTLAGTTGAWIALLAWIGKGIISSIG